MPSLAEGSYAFFTPGFRAGANWAGSLGLENTSVFRTKYSRTLTISYGREKAAPAWTMPLLFISNSLV